MSETADKYRRRGYWLKYLALRHIELLYYKPPFLSTTFSPYFHLFFKKSFPHSSWIADQLFHKSCLLSPPYTRPSTTGVFWNNNLYTLLIRHFINFSLVFFSAMCYIKKNVFTGYTVTILFFQITIQQILFREAFSL